MRRITQKLPDRFPQKSGGKVAHGPQKTPDFGANRITLRQARVRVAVRQGLRPPYSAWKDNVLPGLCSVVTVFGLAEVCALLNVIPVQGFVWLLAGLTTAKIDF